MTLKSYVNQEMVIACAEMVRCLGGVPMAGGFRLLQQIHMNLP